MTGNFDNWFQSLNTKDYRKGNSKLTPTQRTSLYQLRIAYNEPERYLEDFVFKSWKSKAAYYKLPFDITTSKYKVSFYCPFTGIGCYPQRGQGYRHDSPSYILKDKELGYIDGNVIQCSLLYSSLTKRYLKEYSRTKKMPDNNILLGYMNGRRNKVLPEHIDKLMIDFYKNTKQKLLT